MDIETQEQNQDQQTQSQPQNPSTPATPGSHEPPAWQAAIHASRQRELELERQLAELRQQQQTPTQPQTPTFEPGDLVSEPNKFVNFIREELQRSVGPIQQFQVKQQREKNYALLKTRITAQYPQLNAIVSLVDQYIAPILEQRDATEQDVSTSAQQALGWLAVNNPQYLQQLMNPQQAAQPQPQAPQNPQTPQAPVQPPPNIPAHLRTPVQQAAAPKRATWDDLNEHERRLARESKMGPNKFIAYRDCPPDQLMARYEELEKITD